MPHTICGFGMESFDLLRSLELPERAAGGGGSAAVLALALACVSPSAFSRAHPLLGGRLTGEALAAASWFLASSVSASSPMVFCTASPMDGDGDATVENTSLSRAVANERKALMPSPLGATSVCLAGWEVVPKGDDGGVPVAVR